MTPIEEAAGLFGPGSHSWRIDREAIVLAGGSCALLMQAAHPAVAAGVAEHSTYAADPVGRLLRTLTSSYDVIFGSRSTADAALRRVNAIHASVRGNLPGSDVPYSARDPEALLWVHATLVDTALRVYGRFVAPLSAAEEQAYHLECKRVAEALGVPAGDVPPTIGELRAWMAAMVDDGRVRVTPAAREIAATVLYPMRFPPRLAWDAAHLVSLSTLPPSLRRQYGIGWSAARERGMRKIAATTRRVLPWMPGAIRHVPQSRAAERRLRQAREAVG
ncbi:MAG: oxygenase MpaB family protein [Candidatus Limnocylindria bacterium]